jgi:hypothetical protein
VRSAIGFLSDPAGHAPGRATSGRQTG